MWLSSRLSEFSLIELANYVETKSFKSVLRWTRKVRDENGNVVMDADDRPIKEPVIVDASYIEKFRERHNNLGIYRSAFYYNKEDLDVAQRYAPFFFDFDDEEDTARALNDTIKVVDYFQQLFSGNLNPMRIYFTGSKGFHIEVEPVALGINPDLQLDKKFKFAAEKIRDETNADTMDMVVYESRRMWRIVGSQHQKTGLFKNEISYDMLRSLPINKIEEYCSQRQPELDHDVPKLSPAASIWYREMDAQRELERERQEAELSRRQANLFMKYGTEANDVSEALVSAIYTDAVEKLHEEANKPKREQLRNVELYKQSFRLFLIHMRANMDLDAVEAILLEIGQDMGLPQSECSATLRSARADARGKYEDKYATKSEGIEDD